MVGEPSEKEESGHRGSIHQTEQQRSVLCSEVDIGGESCGSSRSDKVDVGSLGLTWDPYTRNKSTKTVEKDRSRERIESRALEEPPVNPPCQPRLGRSLLGDRNTRLDETERTSSQDSEPDREGHHCHSVPESSDETFHDEGKDGSSHPCKKSISPGAGDQNWNRGTDQYQRT